MKKIFILITFIILTVNLHAQINIATTGVSYSQDFNTLASTGTSTTKPLGWAYVETGSNANTTYTANNGASNSGDTYSYGTGTNTDRAFGGLRSGNLIPTFGASFVNNTGTTITSLDISYVGEQWRIGALSRVDRLEFQYSTNATSLTTGTYTAEINLNFTAPNTTSAIGPLDGNITANKTAISYTITGLSIASGSTFWIKWNDYDAPATADDGLAIDDFSITANGNPASLCTEPSVVTSLTFNNGSITSNSIPLSFTAVTADKYIVVRSTNNTLSATPTDGNTYLVNSSLGGGTVISNGTNTSISDNGLTPNTTYYYFIFAYNDVSCTGAPNYNTTAFPTPNDATTLALPACVTPNGPTNPISFTAATNTSISGTFASSGASKYLVIMSSNLPPLGGNPADGTTYTAGQPIGNGNVISYNTTNNIVATGLTAGTTYYFYVFAANDGCTGTQPLYSATFADGNSATTNVSYGIPTGYYNAAAGLTCEPLKTALSTIITNGQITLSYNSIDNVGIPEANVITSDDGLRQIMWDIYTNNTNGLEPFEFNGSQTSPGGFCGASSPASSGICWNKEHTFPKSWFGSQSPTYADLFLVRPTDIKVNSARGNIPYSLVGGSTTFTFPATTSTYPGVPILDKIGASTASGISASSSFEPSDGVKGDIARSYFYILTRYQNNLNNWVSTYTTTSVATVVDGVTGGGIYPSFQIPYLKMLYNWHISDPVDAREITYNNNVFSQQNNRNPFIDHPEYVLAIWGNTCLPGILPVDFVDFTAQKNNSNIDLKWNIANEINTNKYVIERSINGSEFETISTIFSTNQLQYTFEDTKIPNSTIVFYRIKAIDYDGSFKYSKIVSVRLNSNKKILLYPNPAVNILNINLKEIVEQKTSIQITDAIGKIVQQINVAIGTNNLIINTSAFSSGKYFIKIISDKAISLETFVIVK